MDVQLIDHHCHGVTRGQLDRDAFEAFDSLLGIALRQRCAPLLDLRAGAEPEEYLARRRKLGAEEANRRLLTAARLDPLLVDTGLAAEGLLEPGELGELGGTTVHEVVRLESVAEELVARGVEGGEFAAAFATLLRERISGAVAVKSIIAYRHGLDFEPQAPSGDEVAKAADLWLARGGGRLDEPVLLRHVLWEGVATGLPLQLHTGFGDPDENLRRCDPALLADFLRLCAGTDSPVLLLHCYPYHRNAAYLANVLPHVYLDVGLTIPHVGHRAAAVLAETLELAPFHKLLYSSDAYGLAELYVLAAASFREALGQVLGDLEIGQLEQERIAAMIGSSNARRLYGLAG